MGCLAHAYASRLYFHLWVAVCFVFKTGACAKRFTWKWLDFHANERHRGKSKLGIGLFIHELLREPLIIHNLEPSYMSGSHWVATYVRDNVINYFDSFGMPPFQEMVNHAKSKNLTLCIKTSKYKIFTGATCGYFCLYFLNEMHSRGKPTERPYFDLLQVFLVLTLMRMKSLLKNILKIYK